MSNIEEGNGYKVIEIPSLWPEALIKFLTYKLKITAYQNYYK